MLVKKEESVRFENSPACIAFEYPLQDKDINIAFIEINGRYPKTGFVSNQKVKEIVFVVGGKGKVVVEKKGIRVEREERRVHSTQETLFLPRKIEIDRSVQSRMVPRTTPIHQRTMTKA